MRLPDFEPQKLPEGTYSFTLKEDQKSEESKVRAESLFQLNLHSRFQVMA